MTFALQRGAAFLIPSGPNNQMHLHVILSEKCDQGMHLVASTSSIKDGMWHDQTTVLAAGEHKFITKPSFIAYQLLCTMPAAHIENMIARNYYKPQPPVTEELCKKIGDGVGNRSTRLAG